MAEKKVVKIANRMKKKVGVIFGVFCLLFVILLIRVFYISNTEGERYKKIVLAQLDYSSEILPFKRGDILDSKGTVLATSEDVYNVILDARVLTNDINSERLEPTIEALNRCFPELKSEFDVKDYIEDEMKKDITERSSYKVLLKRLPYEDISDFVDEMNDEEKGDLIAGVWFEKEYKRIYPYDSMACDLIGFSTTGNLGMVGLEKQYDDTLNGTNGRTYGYLNSDSNLEKTVIEATDGQNLVTTIDANIQSIVEKAIVDFNNEHVNEARQTGFGSTDTAVLVMDPQTGEVLAMASYPFFDLSNPRDLSSFYTEEEIDAMDEDAKLDKLNKVWNNFVTTYTYEPGSVMKPLTVACGIDTGTLRGDEVYGCNGYEQISDFTIHCVARNGHGDETIADAISDSCNDALMQMSYAIGPDNFSEYEKLFGIGLKTNIDLPGEARTDTLIYNRDELNTLNLAINSFGQSFNVTMIQMASAYCSLINGGTYYQPHVVKKITDSNKNVVEEFNPTVIRRTVSKETSDQVKEYLLETVANGTAKTAKVDGYDIGGKTGTAEKLPRKTGNYLVSFMGYCPQENPEILVYVCINEPNVADQPHSSYAQIIAHQIFEEVLPYMNIEKNEEGKQIEAEEDAAREAEREAEKAAQQEAEEVVDSEDPYLNNEVVEIDSSDGQTIDSPAGGDDQYTNDAE